MLMDQVWLRLILSLGLGLCIERHQLASVNARLEGCVVSGTVRCVPKSKASLLPEQAQRLCGQRGGRGCLAS